MLLIALDKKDPQPAWRQIARTIERLIRTDVLAEGEILPPTRKLARQLSVSRYTVSCAYQELWAQGLLTSAPGSYSRVRKDADRTAAGTGSLTSACPGTDGLIDLGAYNLDAGLFPMRELRRALQRVTRDDDARLLLSGDPRGYGPLREAIAARLRSHSVPVQEENILITNGALHGLDLCFRLLAPDGGKIVVEEPTFDCVLSLCRLYGITPVGVPLREDGLDVIALRKRLRQRGLRFLFTIPSFQNPSGITASRECRESVISACGSSGLPIVEDAFEEEMTYFGGVVLPLKSMDRAGQVLSLGTFSKVLFPGLRVGWVAAEARRIDRLAAIRAARDDGGSTMIQAALHELCVSGSYQKHLELVNRVYSRRMRTALEALSRLVPREKASWTMPGGGYLIWLTLSSDGLTEDELHRLLRAHGVAASAGSSFFSRPPGHLHLRLSISASPEETLVEGISRLGKALEET